MAYLLFNFPIITADATRINQGPLFYQYDKRGDLLAPAIINKLDTQLSPFDPIIIAHERGRRLLKRHLIACRDFHYQSDVILIQYVLISLIAACTVAYRLISSRCVYKCSNVGVKPAWVRVQRLG